MTFNIIRLGQGMTVHWVILGGSSELKLGEVLMLGLMLRF